MKKCLFMIALIASGLTVFADATATDAAPARKHRRQTRPTGGVFERKEAIPSKQIGVVDSQKLLDSSKVIKAIADARWITNIPLISGKGDSGAEIELVESDIFGMMIIEPETFKAKVNMKALSSDGAAAEVIAERLKKELARATFYLLGTGMSKFDLTRSIKNLKELDNLNISEVSAETVTHLNASPRIGVSQIRYATYRTACTEGWAPAPTNDVQKAIWDEVHAIPTEPIKIKP